MAALVLAAAEASHAQNRVAVVDSTDVVRFINANMPGYSAVLVSRSEISTPGFLDQFSALFLSRPTGELGYGFSAEGNARVNAWIGATGNVVLLNGDFADALVPYTYAGVPDPNVQQLIKTSITYAALSGHGFVGEFNGAVYGFTYSADFDGQDTLGFYSGSAGRIGFDRGNSANALYDADGVPLFNPDGVEFGSDVVGFSPGSPWRGGVLWAAPP